MTNRTSTDFDSALTDASKSALLELSRTLVSYSSSMILIGGWAPYLLLRDHPRAGAQFNHVGSIDIDFLLDPTRIGEDAYSTIVELISAQGWAQSRDSRFAFLREIPGPDSVVRTIKVDFLTAKPEDRGRDQRLRQIQPDLEARILDAAEVALSHHSPCRIAGVLPNGAESEAQFELLDMVGCLGTKAFALAGRVSNKDAYDIVSIWDNYGPAISELGDQFRPFQGERLLPEAIRILRRKFESERAEGPTWYANFMNPADEEARARHRQRAFQLSKAFLARVSATYPP